EALTRFWQALPRAPQFSVRPNEARYVWDRWNELQRSRRHIRFGVLVGYPRGDNRDKLLLADTLSPPMDDAPIRVSLQPLPLQCAASVSLVENIERTGLREAIDHALTGDTTSAFGRLQRYPGEEGLRTAMYLYRTEALGKESSGVLVTLIGTWAGLVQHTN